MSCVELINSPFFLMYWTNNNKYFWSRSRGDPHRKTKKLVNCHRFLNNYIIQFNYILSLDQKKRKRYDLQFLNFFQVCNGLTPLNHTGQLLESQAHSCFVIGRNILVLVSGSESNSYVERRCRCFNTTVTIGVDLVGPTEWISTVFEIAESGTIVARLTKQLNNNENNYFLLWLSEFLKISVIFVHSMKFLIGRL